MVVLGIHFEDIAFSLFEPICSNGILKTSLIIHTDSIKKIERYSLKDKYAKNYQNMFFKKKLQQIVLNSSRTYAKNLNFKKNCLVNYFFIEIYAGVLRCFK